MIAITEVHASQFHVAFLKSFQERMRKKKNGKYIVNEKASLKKIYFPKRDPDALLSGPQKKSYMIPVNTCSQVGASLLCTGPGKHADSSLISGRVAALQGQDLSAQP